LDWVKSGRPIDFDMAEVGGMLAGLVAVGLVTSQQAIDMDARATVSQVITSNQVSDCRGN
jgi:electron transfer flavoprotein alpha/beta subunit